jgi:hypothetical protein
MLNSINPVLLNVPAFSSGSDASECKFPVACCQLPGKNDLPIGRDAILL